MKWAGLDVSTSSHLQFLQFGCRTIDMETPWDTDVNGTTNTDFDRVIRYVGKGIFEVHRRKYPTLGMILRHLKAGGAVALAFHWDEDGAVGDHFCLLTGIKNGLVVTVNDTSSRGADTIHHRSTKKVKTWLKRHGHDPVAWFLTIEN